MNLSPILSDVILPGERTAQVEELTGTSNCVYHRLTDLNCIFWSALNRPFVVTPQDLLEVDTLTPQVFVVQTHGFLHDNGPGGLKEKIEGRV